jgi:hypothetical protein
MLGAETAQGLPNDQLFYAFLRGAAKQYGLLIWGDASIGNRCASALLLLVLLATKRLECLVPSHLTYASVFVVLLVFEGMLLHIYRARIAHTHTHTHTHTHNHNHNHNHCLVGALPSNTATPAFCRTLLCFVRATGGGGQKGPRRAKQAATQAPASAQRWGHPFRCSVGSCTLRSSTAARSCLLRAR